MVVANTDNMNKTQTLKTYCESKGINITKLSRLTGLSQNYLYTIADDRNANLNLDTINKIYMATELEFGDGLAVEDYLNIYKREV